MMIRYLLDEHVPHAIAIGLQRRGVEAITLADAKLLGKTDAEIIAYALTQSYVIYTNDDDFPALAAQGVKHAGIIFAKQRRKTIGEIIRHLHLLAECTDTEEMRGIVEYL